MCSMYDQVVIFSREWILFSSFYRLSSLFKKQMKTEEYKFSVSVYDSSDELNQKDAFILSEARSVTQFAYAPYSNFQVGAVARLINGETVTGTNQENASYPAGICAERVLISSAASQFPGSRN